MNKFNELSNLRESQRTLQDYSYQELRKEKLDLYGEVKEFFLRDLFSESESEITAFLENLSDSQKSDAMEYLSEITEIIREQINKLRRDDIPDIEQTDTIESLESEESRVNRFLIKLGYFKH